MPEHSRLMEYDYTEEILSIVCPECCAAITGRCLVRKPTGGSEYRKHPHYLRVLLAEMISRTHMAVDEALRSDEFKQMREEADA